MIRYEEDKMISDNMSVKSMELVSIPDECPPDGGECIKGTRLSPDAPARILPD